MLTIFCGKHLCLHWAQIVSCSEQIEQNVWPFKQTTIGRRTPLYSSKQTSQLVRDSIKSPLLLSCSCGSPAMFGSNVHKKLVAVEAARLSFF